MHAAYREVGSYRAAAEICGTTPKTVKRSVLAAQAAENGKIPVVEQDYDAVRDVVVERVERPRSRSRPNGYCPWPAQPATAARIATSVAWWPR